MGSVKSILRPDMGKFVWAVLGLYLGPKILVKARSIGG